MKNVQILWVHHTKTGPQTEIKKNYHGYYQMHYCNGGSASFQVDEKTYTINKGQGILINKNVPHSFCNQSETEIFDNFEIKFFIRDNSLESVLDKMPYPVFFVPCVEPLIYSITTEYIHTRSLKEDASNTLLETILYLITSEARVSESEVGYAIDVTGYSDLSKQVIFYLGQHYKEEITLEQVSDAVCVSKNYLCNAFKKDTETTILNCLNYIRVKKSAELLLYSDMSIAEIADQTGFSSANHFNRVFIRYVGLPPSQCRIAYPSSIISRKGEQISIPGQYIYSALTGSMVPLSNNK